ncbi:MAG: alpha/beta hydrolase [Proteobacteria bacterium]|nr:alpha/beta hydrolase [Pseudomonadota bacterium]MBU4470834.1 alpha/beta hydrolase [Pseudomonadota bacterium]MCG2750968.1 alpha/beta hydrolase [Desulfobacteraceae bacterium]
MKIKTNGIMMNCEVKGEGECLVLIHGFTDNLNMWTNQVSEISKTCKVVTLDVRGHGQTETPEGDLSMDLFAEDIRGLLDVLKVQKACILGYSMGGRIGLQFALKYPEKVAGLVFANSGIAGVGYQMPEEQMKEMMARREQMMELYQSKDIERISDSMAERSMTPGIREKNPNLFKTYKAVKLQNNPEHYFAIMQAMGAAAANPPDLSKIKCPVLIIAGDQDAFMSMDVTLFMAKTIDRALLKVFPTGHASAIEVPEAFNQTVLDFMKIV